MKTKQTVLTAIGVMALFIGQSAMAGSLQHFGNSAGHSVQAVGEGVAGVAKTTFGVVAIPLKGIGAVGKASGEVGDGFWDAANAPVKPLPISDENITSGPAPDKMFNQRGDDI